MLERLGILRPSAIRGSALAAAVAFTALVAGNAQAQINVQVAKRCIDPIIEGAPLDCESKVPWENTTALGGSNAPIVIRSGVDEFPLPGVTLDLAIAKPNHPAFAPADAVSGNAACSGACDPVTGAGCLLPCIICEAGDTSTVSLDGPLPEAGGTLDCPGILERGAIHFLDDRLVTECPAGQVEDQVTHSVRNECGGDLVPPDLTCGETPNDQQANAAVICEGETPPTANFKCYAAKPEHGTSFDPKLVSLTDQFDFQCIGGDNNLKHCEGDADCPGGSCEQLSATLAEVAHPFELCAPVTKLSEGENEPVEDIIDPEAAHLMCYKLLSDQSGPNINVRDTDQWGSQQNQVTNPWTLCQPALKNCVPDDTAEPPITCTLDDLDELLAHLNCYSAVPNGICSVSGEPCHRDRQCGETGGTCVAQPGNGGVPSTLPLTVVTRDQFDLQCVGGDNDGDLCADSSDCPEGTCEIGEDLTALGDTAFHCNPLLEKQVAGRCVDGPYDGAPCFGGDCDTGTCEGGTTEDFEPPIFRTPFPFDVPLGVEPPEQVHYTCYDIEDPEVEIRTVTVEDQFGINPITIGRATRLCEPAVKDEVEVKRAQGCGLIGIEALLGLLPLAYWQRRRARQGGQA